MIVFIADFFVDQILGGGELNNEECIKILSGRGCTVEKIQSHLVTPAFINRNKSTKFIVANFLNLSPEVRTLLLDRDYVIYEHDHKYLRSRDPAPYPNFEAPKEELVNLDFYRSAQAVLCQSQFHLDIIFRNTGLTNLVNLSGNLWSEKALELIQHMARKPKQPKSAVINSPILHKNTSDAVRYCEAKNLDYELVSGKVYEEFLQMLGSNEAFIFLPKTPETLSRIVVEAKMMNMSVSINKMLGASREPWFTLKGEELIAVVREMRERIPTTILEALGCDST